MRSPDPSPSSPPPAGQRGRGTRLGDLPLRVRLSLAFALLTALLMVFVQLYVPQRLELRSTAWAIRRATSMARLLGKGIAPDLRAGDTKSVEDHLAELSSEPDVLYAAIRSAEGAILMGWQLDAAPPLVGTPEKDALIVTDGSRLHAVVPVTLRDGSKAWLQVGFDLGRLEREHSDERWILSGMTLALFALGVAMSIFIGIRITRPVQELTEVAAHIAASGDLRREIRIDSRDEVGRLADSLRAIVEKLRSVPASLEGTVGGVVHVVDHVSQTARTVGEGASVVSSRVEETSASVGQMLQVLRNIAQNVEALATSADESAASNTAMAEKNDGMARQVKDTAKLAAETRGAVEQATAWIRQISVSIEELNASVESTSASMSEMDTSIGEVENNARESSKLSAESLESSLAGVNAIQETISGIARIRDQSAIVAKLIDSLGQRLSHIGDIAQVIDSVAGQTNLLALNAAIIAAQAGEQGRGFAVVADEIKGLATRTAASTQEIRSLIEGIGEESTRAVTAVEETMSSIDAGVRLGGEAQQALARITVATERATTMVRAIATSTLEQSRASRQVTGAVHRIAESIQRINDATREQARSSERITATVTDMQSVTQNVLRAAEDQRQGAGQIASSVQNISRMVRTLSTAQHEQTLGAEQVLRAIEAIRDVATGQGAAVRELQTALGELQGHAGELNAAVHQFKV